MHKTILQYGHIDILNYEIPLMVIILSKNREKQKYVAPYKIYVNKEYLVLVIFYVLVLKYIIQYNPIDTLYSKSPLLVLIL